VPLVVQNYYEPYAWLVLFAIVPWWLEAVHGLRRPGRPQGNLVLLGLIGAGLFMTYYYFFFIAAIALVIHVAVERSLGELRWRQLRRGAAVMGIAAAGSAVYWLPLGLSLLRAEHPQSLANRWFNTGHPRLPLPMTEVSVTGAVALLGLVFLLWTVRREPLSRGLLVFTAAAYTWYLVGAAAAVLDSPLLSFRGKPLIPMLLLIAGILAMVRAAGWATGRFPAPDRRRDVRRVVAVLGVVLAVFAGQSMVTSVRDSDLMAEAHATALPGNPPPDPPPAQVQRAIDLRFDAPGHPVLLSDRVDLLVLYPNYGFLQWNAHYAHPAAEFDERVEFLRQLSTLATPAEFAARSAENRFDRIDAFVLLADGDELVYRFSADAFPGGLRADEVRFPRTLFDAAAFTLVPMGDHVLAIRR
jgi:galactan 5-O-arabinofuranosyltransferase